jgi:hypothetical protein
MQAQQLNHILAVALITERNRQMQRRMVERSVVGNRIGEIYDYSIRRLTDSGVVLDGNQLGILLEQSFDLYIITLFYRLMNLAAAPKPLQYPLFGWENLLSPRYHDWMNPEKDNHQ